VDYNGQPAGYTADPQEVISYVEAHDNETLFDAVQLKAAPGADLAARGAYLHLQDHGDPVWYRAIKLRTLPPEAQLDRFMVRIILDYPTAQEEIEIFRRRYCLLK